MKNCIPKFWEWGGNKKFYSQLLGSRTEMKKVFYLNQNVKTRLVHPFYTLCSVFSHYNFTQPELSLVSGQFFAVCILHSAINTICTLQTKVFSVQCPPKVEGCEMWALHGARVFFT